VTGVSIQTQTDSQGYQIYVYIHTYIKKPKSIQTVYKLLISKNCSNQQLLDHSLNKKGQKTNTKSNYINNI